MATPNVHPSSSTMAAAWRASELLPASLRYPPRVHYTNVGDSQKLRLLLMKT